MPRYTEPRGRGRQRDRGAGRVGERATRASQPKDLKIVVVGQTPPPVGGQAIAIESFLRGDYRRLALTHVRMGFSSDFREVGRFSFGKVLHLFALVWQIHRARLRSGATVLYYPPAGPDLVPVLRDLIVLLGTRWAFQHTVLHFHAGGLSEIYPRLPAPLRPLFRLAYGKPSMSLQPSELNPPDGRFLSARHQFVVANGVRDEFPGRVDRAETWPNVPVILFAGVLRESKGLLVLVEACALLRARGARFRVHLMGQPESAEFERELHAAIDAAGLSDAVSFLGVVTGWQKRDAFLSSHVFCYPTHFESETFGLVLLEAMQFELPIVATRWRGVPTSVRDGHNGYLVPIRDAAAVADRLEILLADPQTARAMGRRGRQLYLDSFTERHFQRSMEECLVTLADDERSAGAESGLHR
jgi:glycosyltransferase involved in cell wall biosynthesis